MEPVHIPLCIRGAMRVLYRDHGYDSVVGYANADRAGFDLDADARYLKNVGIKDSP